MGNSVIRVRGLGKQYRIGAAVTPSQTKYGSIMRLLQTPFHYLQTVLRPPTEGELLWAVKDICFDVQQGDIVGLIGPNGAGKSTLFKLLSRITEPTTGYAELHGRVGSLLEVGTGFNPELTGRDNIYLNGTIIGLRKREIDRNFDAIVDFSGVEKFIDTPVKHYSSGMYVRLAFAIASQLDLEIMLVDEVLAVGDRQFQNRCIRRIQELAREGRTIICVSHNIYTMNGLCNRGLLLHHGQLMADGPIDQVIKQYERQVQQSLWQDVQAMDLDQEADGLNHLKRNEATGEIVINQVILQDQTGAPESAFTVGSTMTVRVHYTVYEPLQHLVISFGCFRQKDGLMCTMSRSNFDGQTLDLEPGDGWFEFTLKVQLNSGIYLLGLAIANIALITEPYVLYYQNLFHITDPPMPNIGDSTGIFFADVEWRFNADSTHA